MYACVHAADSGKLADLAGAFSPTVEMAGPDTAVFSLRGLAGLFGDTREIVREMVRRAAALELEFNLAVAATPDAAILAAHHIPGINLIEPGEESRKLGSLAIESLPITPELFETLDRWGIRTLAEFVRLPEAGLAERLGQEGLALHALVRGIFERPLRPALPPASFEETLELDHPLALLEPLLFVLSRQLTSLVDRLRSQSLAAAELDLLLILEQGEHARTLRLPVPSRDTKAMLKLLQLDLEAHPPPAAILKVTLRIHPVEPRAIQNDFFVPAAPEPEKLELTLAKIRAMVGADRVGIPELVDTHRPGAFRMGAGMEGQGSEGNGSLGFRVLRPPRAAQVDLISGVPRRISAGAVRGRIVRMAGPWRTSGDWWTGDPWDRDEWDLALDNGALYRVFYDRLAGRWFLEGSYD